MFALSSLEDVSVHPTPYHYTCFFDTFPQLCSVIFLSCLQNTALCDIFFAEDALTNKHAFGEIKLNEKGHRMTIARQREPQPIVNNSDRENFFSVVPATSDVIILGENATTEQQVQQKNTPELQAAIDSERIALDRWIDFIVKNELVKQLYKTYGDEDSDINIDTIADIISTELVMEKEKNIHQALHLNSAMNTAVIRESKDPKSAHDYGNKDVENLQRRIDVHHDTILRIKEIEAAGADKLYDLANTHIKRTQLGALKEVVNILAEQKKELENQTTLDGVRIAELEDVIVSLKSEIKQANEQLVSRDDQLADRDMQLLNNEFVDHLAHVDDLTKVAQQLAR